MSWRWIENEYILTLNAFHIISFLPSLELLSVWGTQLDWYPHDLAALPREQRGWAKILISLYSWDEITPPHTHTHTHTHTCSLCRFQITLHQSLLPFSVCTYHSALCDKCQFYLTIYLLWRLLIIWIHTYFLLLIIDVKQKQHKSFLVAPCPPPPQRCWEWWQACWWGIITLSWRSAVMNNAVCDTSCYCTPSIRSSEGLHCHSLLLYALKMLQWRFALSLPATVRTQNAPVMACHCHSLLLHTLHALLWRLVTVTFDLATVFKVMSESAPLSISLLMGLNQSGDVSAIVKIKCIHKEAFNCSVYYIDLNHCLFITVQYICLQTSVHNASGYHAVGMCISWMAMSCCMLLPLVPQAGETLCFQAHDQYWQIHWEEASMQFGALKLPLNWRHSKSECVHHSCPLLSTLFAASLLLLLLYFTVHFSPFSPFCFGALRITLAVHFCIQCRNVEK